MRPTVKAFEAFLRASGIPYVAVTETKRALFSGVRLKAFDFVVYSAAGPNILATVKPFSQGNMRAEMGRWEEVFGKGFAAAEEGLLEGRDVLLDRRGPMRPQALRSVVHRAEAAPKLARLDLGERILGLGFRRAAREADFRR
jgi:hypothetical protein